MPEKHYHIERQLLRVTEKLHFTQRPDVPRAGRVPSPSQAISDFARKALLFWAAEEGWTKRTASSRH
jgi:hypothetical protein